MAAEVVNVTKRGRVLKEYRLAMKMEINNKSLIRLNFV